MNVTLVQKSILRIGIICLVITVAVLISTLCSAQVPEKRVNMAAFSPSLRRFLAKHSGDSQVLSNILAEAFSNRYSLVFYFYTDDPSAPQAEHYYPTQGEVMITIRAGLEPADEYLSLIFECVNSEGEPRFEQLISQANAGTISRADFAAEMTKQELVALRRTRDLLKSLQFTREEKSASLLYKHLKNTPDTYDEFLTYCKAQSPPMDWLTGYEQQYDILRKSNANHPDSAR